jgi:ClpP class serine protease
MQGDEPLTGKMYFAQEAVSFGLIDGVLNFEQTIERARELGATKKKTQKILV